MVCFVRGMIFFSLLCLLSSFFITLCNKEKIRLLYYISIFSIFIFYLYFLCFSSSIFFFSLKLNYNEESRA